MNVPFLRRSPLLSYGVALMLLMRCWGAAAEPSSGAERVDAYLDLPLEDLLAVEVPR